jgi:hypothetical protein
MTTTSHNELVLFLDLVGLVSFYILLSVSNDAVPYIGQGESVTLVFQSTRIWIPTSSMLTCFFLCKFSQTPGAMMAIEDAGTLCRLIQKVCCSTGKFDDTKFAHATQLYQDLRLPRTQRILESSHELGKTQQRRAESWLYNLYRELSIAVQVQLYGTLPIMIPGATFSYETAVDEALASTSRVAATVP